MKNCFKVFLSAFVIFAVAMLVAIIPYKGIWIYYGDFNVQQIPFYIHLHDAIRSGNFLYDWSTDLGGSIVGCYSFYILGSPFFWLTVPFPSEAVIYLIPWINCLKYAVMATTAYIYMKKHLKTEYAAVIGAMLYAFSGYSGAVLVYNHFHDVLAFFPLFLLAFEEMIENKKRVRFILMTSFMLLINYYFFVGEAVFLIIYFIVHYYDKENVKEFFKKLSRAFYCAVTGVLLTGIYILPAIYYTRSNERVTDILNGEDMVAYAESTMIPAIIKNTVMLPDISGLNSMFNQSYSRVSGVAAYLPLISVALVIAFFCQKNKTDKTRKLLTVCAVFACIPVLNSLFSALNDEYYARWFFMPILIMALASAKVIEELSEETLPYIKKGTGITLLLNAAVWVCALLPTKKDEGWTILGAVKNPELLLSEIIFSAIMMILLVTIVYIIIPSMMNRHKEKQAGEENGEAITEAFGETLAYRRFSMIAIAAGCLLTAVTMMVSGKVLVERERCEGYIEQGIKGKNETVLPDNRFYRIENDEDIYNYPMIWSKPAITSFISTIPGSTIDFYYGIGSSRKVTSKIHESRIGARTLLSGKYYLIEGENSVAIETIGHIDDVESLKGYEYMDTINGFDVYRNMYYIPMGFSFKYYITEEDYEENEASTGTMDKMLLKALVLSKEDAETYGYLMNRIVADNIPTLGNVDMPELSADLRSRTCNTFKTTTHGFTATVDMEKDNLLFFSVPYESGFTAYVDGVKTDIVKVDWGFMAIPVGYGEHDIEFKYIPSDMPLGAVLTLAGLIMLTGVLVFQNTQKGKITKENLK